MVWFINVFDGDAANMEVIAFDLGPRQAIPLTSCGAPISTKKIEHLDALQTPAPP